jgi:hypothetical protein
MRLLEFHHSGEFSLAEFVGKNIPRYAILSHTWGEDGEEVTFKDLVDGVGKTKAGYSKIQLCGEQAASDGLKYVWVDTCCIDKSSSADLSEAINSMYQWYQRSEVCYAFLSDLTPSASMDAALRKCRWFTRGWTLQELIAPVNVHFFDQDWNHRGSKKDIVELLSSITGISSAILRHEQRLSSIAVAQKMSWAAHRETTRIEDMAYCLLGIFDVNMPLLYGEERKAFRRLQEEIIKSTADFSIFAWEKRPLSINESMSGTRLFCGVLAETPFAFAGCTSVTKESNFGLHEFSITNIGVRTRVPILSDQIPGRQGYRYILPLNCYRAHQQILGIILRKCGPDQFIREDPSSVVESTQLLYPRSIKERYLLTEFPEMNMYSDSLLLDRSMFIARTRSHALQVKLPPNIDIHNAWPEARFDDEDQLFFLPSGSSGRWDSCALKLNAQCAYRVGRRNIDVGFECMFYAVGWSDKETSCLQCTLVDFRSFATALNEVQSDNDAGGYDRHQVLDQLALHQIPKCSSAIFSIPGTEASTIVSFTSTQMLDFSICQNKFWRIEFSSKVCKAKDVPKIRNEEWDLESY